MGLQLWGLFHRAGSPPGGIEAVPSRDGNCGDMMLAVMMGNASIFKHQPCNGHEHFGNGDCGCYAKDKNVPKANAKTAQARGGNCGEGVWDAAAARIDGAT